jgi:hypothetical protein
MSVRAAQRLFVGYLLIMTVFLTYPGIVPFNRVWPLILGLPFNVFWVAAWVSLGFVVLLIVDRAVTRAERSEHGR